MRTEIFFKDIRRSEYLERFINDKIEALTDKLIQSDKDLHIQVRLAKEKQRTPNRHPAFQCEVTVKSGISDKVLKVVKHDRNIFRAISCAHDSLKTLLRRSHDRLCHSRRSRRRVAPVYGSVDARVDQDGEFDNFNSSSPMLPT